MLLLSYHNYYQRSLNFFFFNLRTGRASYERLCTPPLCLFMLAPSCVLKKKMNLRIFGFAQWQSEQRTPSHASSLRIHAGAIFCCEDKQQGQIKKQKKMKKKKKKKKIDITKTPTSVGKSHGMASEVGVFQVFRSFQHQSRRSLSLCLRPAF